MGNVALPSATQAIVDKDGRPLTAMRKWFEGIQRRVGGAVDFVAIAYQAATDAAASGSLAGVATVADAALSQVALLGSFPVGLTLQGIAATATILVGGHTRRYLIGQPPVTVTGATISGLSYATTYWIFYDQSSRGGGAVTYQVSTTYTDAFPTHSTPHRHFVGAITMPATSGSANTAGKSALPPGYTGP
jgi:hypothetical protein